MTNLVSDVYAATLYAACDGLPLWYPTPCDVGDIGFVRAGMFYKIFAASEGPQSAPMTFASNVSNALRTETNGSSASSFSSAENGEASTLKHDSSSRHPSLIHQLGKRLSNGSQGAPLPLNVEEAGLQTFDMGPRMSSNYRSLGTTLGGDAAAAGVPLGATLTFESCGGDGALLVARDPVHRRALKHVGVLKAYMQQHREYIHKTYGEAEDFELDELTMIFGQDSTSDWAVAVNIASSVGARVEFEVFSALQAGVWGKWNSTCTASQRGPHRLEDDSKHEKKASPAIQTIVIRRITAKSRTPFFAPKMHAAAGPSRDGHDHYRRRDGEQVRPLEGGDGRDEDPLDMLHEYILLHTDESVKVSIATDQEALLIFKVALHLYRSASAVPMTREPLSLKSCLWVVAEETATICVDGTGYAAIEIREADVTKLQNAIFAAAPTQPHANDGVARRSESFLMRNVLRKKAQRA